MRKQCLALGHCRDLANGSKHFKLTYPDNVVVESTASATHHTVVVDGVTITAPPTYRLKVEDSSGDLVATDLFDSVIAHFVQLFVAYSIP